MNFDLIAGLVLSSLVAAGKPKAVELLQELYTKNAHDYKAAIFALNAGAEHLKSVTEKTATNLDDAALAAVQDILASSAAANGLSL